jgi:hypothetical protein
LSDMLKYIKWGYIVVWRTKDNSMKVGDRQMMYNIGRMADISVKFKERSMKWNISMMVNISGITFTKELISLNYGLDYMSFKSSIADLSIDYMSLLSTKTMTIKQMNMMFLELGWVKNDISFWKTEAGTTYRVYSTKETFEMINSQNSEEGTFETDALSFQIEDMDFDSEDEEEEEEEDDMEIKTNYDIDLPFNEIDKAIHKVDESEPEEEELYGKNLKLERLMIKIMDIVLKGKVKENMTTIREYARLNIDRVGNYLFNSLCYVLSEFMLDFKVIEMLFFRLYKTLMLEIKVPTEFRIELMDLVTVEVNLNRMLADGFAWPIQVTKEWSRADSYGF